MPYQNIMTIDEFAKILPRVWTPRSDMEMHEIFVADDPATGQCAVTALLVQDFFGGEILNTTASLPKRPELTSSHYVNLIDSKEIDLTRQQFVKGVIFSKPEPKLNGFSSTREYILSVTSTAERYEQLKDNTERILAI